MSIIIISSSSSILPLSVFNSNYFICIIIYINIVYL